MTEDDMDRWHHQLDGHESEQAPVVGDGQGSLACCSPWGCKRIGHYRTTELNLNSFDNVHSFYNMSITLSRFVTAFLLRSKRLLISLLLSPSTVILEPKKRKSVTVSTSPPSVCHEMMGPMP